MKNRLFLAIDPSKTTTSYLSELQRRMSHSNLRLPSSFHLTLSFLGNRSIEKTLEQLETLSFSPFSLTLTAIGAFPSKKSPRVIWVGVQHEPELFRLHNKLVSALDAESPFHPHITLARVKGKIPDELFNIAIEPLRFSVESFTLYNSTLTPQGPQYKEIKVFSASQN